MKSYKTIQNGIQIKAGFAHVIFTKYFIFSNVYHIPNTLKAHTNVDSYLIHTIIYSANIECL